MLAWRRRGHLLTIAALIGLGAFAGCAARDRRDINAVNGAPPLESSGITTQSWPLCALVGPQSDRSGVFGTDLGYTVHEPSRGPGDRLAILFGDTWAENADRDCRFPRLPADDLAGWLPATRPPSLVAGPPAPNAAAGCGLLELPAKDASNPASWPPIHLFENDEAAKDGKPLETTALKTPLSAFSDGKRVYAFYGRNEPAFCGKTSDCPKGLECSIDATHAGSPNSRARNLGECAGERAPRPGQTPTWCRDAMDCSPKLSCRTADHGTCLETEPFWLQTEQGPVSPAWYRNDPRLGVAHPIYLAARVADDRPTDYVVLHRLVTQRFISLATRTVAHFDPDDASRNDYSPGNHTLFVWGRPWWVGSGGAQSLPFLFYVPLEELSRGTFHPRYFGGYGPSGAPRWVDNEGDAHPIYGAEGTVDASGTRIDWREPEFDYVNTMSLTWLASLGRWLMVYGGDLPAFMVKDERTRGVMPPKYRVAATLEPLLTRREAAPYMACGEGGEAVMPGCLKEPDAAHPRSEARSPNSGTPAAANTGEKQKGRETSLGPKCIAGDMFISVQEGKGLTGNPIGRLYGPNVIEEWTDDVTSKVGGLGPGERAVEIYFNVSTWNPYQVVLVKTQIRGSAAR